MAKLTLSVDATVIERAKRYASKRGTSVSGLVEQLLDLAASGSDDRDITPPVLSRLRGSIKGVDVRDYHRYLERKYR
ncbi:MAG: antitoxin [Cyanobacteria bacterium]|nr:antitoxin [Cyanobacteriota bacterium]